MNELGDETKKFFHKVSDSDKELENMREKIKKIIVVM